MRYNRFGEPDPTKRAPTPKKEPPEQPPEDAPEDAAEDSPAAPNEVHRYTDEDNDDWRERQAEMQMEEQADIR